MRYGVVLPAANTTIESEFPQHLPRGATAHFQRFGQLVRTEEELQAGLTAMTQAARELAPARITAVGVGYTAGSYVGGIDWDVALRKSIEESLNRPAVTAASAIVDALRHVAPNRVGVVSPYPADLNAKLERYLTAAGFLICRVVGSPSKGPAGDVAPRRVRQMVMSLQASDPDAILISCTGLRTVSLIEELEERLDIPVVSSNQALLWALGKTALARPSGPGRLFRIRSTPGRNPRRIAPTGSGGAITRRHGPLDGARR